MACTVIGMFMFWEYGPIFQISFAVTALQPLSPTVLAHWVLQLEEGNGVDHGEMAVIRNQNME